MNKTHAAADMRNTFWKVITALFFAIQFASAQNYAPTRLAIGSIYSYSGQYIDSNQGTVPDGNVITIQSATTFTGQNGETGTYTYTKTGAATARLNYTATYSEPGYTETETAIVLITFTDYGVATFTSSGSYSGNDGGDPFSGTFTGSGTITYNGPTISDVTDKSTNEDTSTGAIPFSVGSSATNNPTVTRASSNTTLVPLANVVLGGTANNRTVTITPAPNLFGTSTITLTVTAGNLTTSDTFVLTVTAVNDAPTISNVADQSTAKNTSTAVIPFTIGDIDTAIGSLTVTPTSSNTTLVPHANVVLVGSGANRTVTITPAANQSGTATITLTVNDGSRTATDTFVLTVLNGQTLTSWRQSFFSSPDNSGDGAGLNDFDKDGLVNLLEYALGSDPTDSASGSQPPTTTEMFNNQPYLTLTITKPPGVSGITYLVEVSENLVVWNSGQLNTTIITNNGTTLKVRSNTPALGGSGFIRLKVTSP